MIELLAQPVPAATDFWGVVVPSYIAAVGGLISAVIGGVALFQSYQNKGSTRSIVAALNDQHLTRAASSGAARSRAEIGSPRWSVVRAGRQLHLLNHAADAVQVTKLENVGAARGVTIRLSSPLPAEVEPSGSLEFTIERRLISASITAIRIEWVESARIEVEAAGGEESSPGAEDDTQSTILFV